MTREGRRAPPPQPGTAPVGSLTAEMISASRTTSLILRRSRGEFTEIMMTVPGEGKTKSAPTISDCSVAQVEDGRRWEEGRGGETVRKL